MLEQKFAQTFSCFGIGPRRIFSFSVDWGWRSSLCRTVCSSVFTSATSLQAFSSFTLKLSSLAFCRFTISPSSLIVSNNCRISRFETTRFSRFLIESSRKGSGWDGTALDRAPVDELEPNARQLKVVLVLPLQKKDAATSMSKLKSSSEYYVTRPQVEWRYSFLSISSKRPVSQ